MTIVALALVQSGAAGPGASLGNFFFGPKLVRAEVVTNEAGAIHDYRVDRGRIRAIARAAEPDAARAATARSSPFPSPPSANIRSAACRVPFTRLRRGFTATTVRDGTAAGLHRAGDRAERDARGVSRAGTALVVEDEDSIATLVRSYLERDGFTVVRARSGEEALDELERRPVRVVVLDIGLPDMDGFDVCRSIRARSRVPILMLTARDEEPDRVSGLELGADDYVTKPFSPRELLARVKAVLRRDRGVAATRPELALGDVVVAPRRAGGDRRRRRPSS